MLHRFALQCEVFLCLSSYHNYQEKREKRKKKGRENAHNTQVSKKNAMFDYGAAYKKNIKENTEIMS